MDTLGYTERTATGLGSESTRMHVKVPSDQLYPTTQLPARRPNCWINLCSDLRGCSSQGVGGCRSALFKFHTACGRRCSSSWCCRRRRRCPSYPSRRRLLVLRPLRLLRLPAAATTASAYWSIILSARPARTKILAGSVLAARPAGHGRTGKDLDGTAQRD